MALKSPKQVYSDYATRADASVAIPDLSPVMKLYEERMPTVPGESYVCMRACVCMCMCACDFVCVRVCLRFHVRA